MRRSWIGFILFFLFIMNIGGHFLVKGEATEEVAVEEMVIDHVRVNIVNEGGYPKEMVAEVKQHIEAATQDVLRTSKGILIPLKAVDIYLTPSEADTIFVPSYLSNIIYDPDYLYLDEYNFHELMFSALFEKVNRLSPFTTIGAGHYLYAQPLKGQIYDAHEMWIIHRQHERLQILKSEDLTALLDSGIFYEEVVKKEENGYYDLEAQANYWKIASFSFYLIEEYGLNSYLKLYPHFHLPPSIEKEYGISMEALEKNWTDKITRMENSFTPKHRGDLKRHFDYLYGLEE